MISNTPLVISALLLVLIIVIVQSIPIEIAKKIVPAPSIDHKQADKQQLLKSVDSVGSSSDSASSTISSTTISSQKELPLEQEKSDHKTKRNIFNNDQFDELLTNEDSDESSEQSSDLTLNNNNKHILHANIQETSVKIHDNADKPVDTDDSSVFSDITMTPNELTDIVRRRRDVKLNMESSRRRKRALSPYDLYDTDSLYDPYVDLVEGQQYARSVRSFAPLYWYPGVYERSIRAALAPSFYESSEWPQLYSANILNDNDDDNLASLYGENNDDDDDDVTDYELNRYPLLLQSNNNPFDNLQLQQKYNTDDLPLDDDDIEESLNDENDDRDNDEEQYRSNYENQYPYYTRYGSLDTYFE